MLVGVEGGVWDKGDETQGKMEQKICTICWRWQKRRGEAAADGLVHWWMRLGNWIWKRGYAVSLLISLSCACTSK